MALTMIDPATSWFKVVELPLVRWLKTITVNNKESSIVEEIFDKTSEHIAWLVNKMWLSRYQRCCYIIYNNGSEFKLIFEYLCETYGIRHKSTTIKNPQANAIFGVLTPSPSTDVTHIRTWYGRDNNPWWPWCIPWQCSMGQSSTYHTALKAYPGAGILGRYMLFDILFIAKWNKIGDYRQRQTNF